MGENLPIAQLPDGARTKKLRRAQGPAKLATKKRRAAEWANGEAQKQLKEAQQDQEAFEQEYASHLERIRLDEDEQEAARLRPP